MTAKKIVIQVLVRLALLVIPLFGVWLWMYLSYDPHKLCEGNNHRHTMGPVGYVILGGIVFIVWFLAVLFDLILRIFKDNRISFGLIFLIIFAGIFLMIFI